MDFQTAAANAAQAISETTDAFAQTSFDPKTGWHVVAENPKGITEHTIVTDKDQSFVIPVFAIAS